MGVTLANMDYYVPRRVPPQPHEDVFFLPQNERQQGQRSALVRR